jgi:putative redox protein
MQCDRPGPADAVRPDLRIGLTWRHDLVFDTGPAGTPPHTLDGNSREAPSPPQVLLEALAGCVSVDVVLILQKKRTPATAISCEITAERAEGVPRRLVKVHLHYRITGDNIPLANAERSIELAVTKYCTVRDTLDPNMPITWSVEISDAARGSRAVALEGEPG